MMMQILKISIERLCMYLQRIKKREYGFAICAGPHHADKDLIFVALFYDKFNSLWHPLHLLHDMRDDVRPLPSRNYIA